MSTDITVAIATRNRPELLERALASATGQAGVGEVVVVDDGSSPEDARRNRSICGDDVRLLRLESLGLSANRNAALAVAGSSWIVFLDDDDALVPDTLGSLDLGAAAPTCLAVSYGADLVTPDGEVIERKVPTSRGEAFYGAPTLFLAGSFAVRVDAARGIGGFLHGLECSHQTELWLRLTSYAHRAGAELQSLDRVGVEITKVPDADRTLRRPGDLYRGTRKILALHGDQLARDPQLLASYCAIAGLAASRMGLRREAVALLSRAVRHEPGNVRSWGRLAVHGATPRRAGGRRRGVALDRAR